MTSLPSHGDHFTFNKFLRPAKRVVALIQRAAEILVHDVEGGDRNNMFLLLRFQFALQSHVMYRLLVFALIAIALGSQSLPLPSAGSEPSPIVIKPAAMKRIATVDERYQSYNIEMAEVTGGSFWKPYPKNESGDPKPAVQSGANVPAGMNPNIYQYRPPIDLSNARRRKLAAALGPAYVRVSGTWANTTYFVDNDAPTPKEPPAGFSAILTRTEWRGVVDFSRAVNANIVSSVAISPGTRTTSGVWMQTQARALYAYTRSIGGAISATEYMNEPTMALMGGAPKWYTAADYGHDVKIFRAFLKSYSPATLLLGPGSVGEGGGVAPPATAGFLSSANLLKSAGPVFDVFSYHYYGAASQRCASMGMPKTTAAAAFSETTLSGTDKVYAFYARLRDTYEPGKAVWITETADAACGGDPWAKTFLDTFRYLDQLGRLAQHGVRVVFHNTLDSSDYGLLDENTLQPRPDYWAALLWHRLMGTTVLSPGVATGDSLNVYAHCLRGVPGGVALLAINLDRSVPHSMVVPEPAIQYTLSAKQLDSASVLLNGHQLQLGLADSLPMLVPVSENRGTVAFGPATITFLAIPTAGNPACGNARKIKQGNT